MKKAFTLSEVLIAMAVLGVVSALTIPHIAGDTTKKQYITTYKQTIAAIESAAPAFKLQNGYDYSGSRTITGGATAIRNILETQLGAVQTKLKTAQQWTVTGLVGSSYEVVGSYSPAEGDPYSVKTQAFLGTASKVNNTNLTASQTLAFGHANETNYKATGNVAYGTTLKLQNGAYILIPDDAVACNFKNPRWNATTSAYVNPDQTKNTNATSNINLCVAFIDVNGKKGPNRITTCIGEPKIVSPLTTLRCANMHSKEVADVFPVFFYDSSVSPANAAGFTILEDMLVD